jgi:4-amino-4-deoxy-L-arabinose transferase-like glycosyltransferase
VSVETEASSARRALSLWPYALLLAVGILVLVPKLGDFGLWDPWEPKYVESAREMLERDSYIVPYYRDDVRLAKPILVYWGVLAGASVFGLNEFGARIVGVCLALATMAGVFYSVSRLRGRQAGLISALVLGTAPQFYFIARQAMPDVYLFTSMGLCLLFFSLGLFRPDKRRNLHFGISYACAAFAVLAKGPVIVGSVLLTTLAIYTLVRIDLHELWRRGRRPETLRFAGTVVPAVAMLPLLSLTGYLFGTSPAWWGYSDKSRDKTWLLRGRIQELLTRSHLADLILVLVAAGAVALIVQVFRRGRQRRPTSLGMAAFPALASIAAVSSLAVAEPAFKIFASSILGAAACLYVVAVSTRRFLRQDWLWPVVQPPLKQIGRQVLLFLIVFIVIAGPWHVGILIKEDHGYVSDFIIKHNIHRAGDTVNRTGVSSFYLGVLIFGLFPWSCFLPVALALVVGWWDRNPLKRYGLEVFLLIASAVTFAVFTAPVTKFSHYLSPLVVPVCVLIGLGITRTLEKRHAPASRLAWIVAAMLFVLPALDLLAEGGFIQLVGSFTMKAWVPAELAAGPYYRGLLAFAGACLLASIIVRSRVLVAGLVVAATLMASYSAAHLIPAVSKHKTMKHLCETWKEEARDGEAPICFFGDMKHGIFFYTEHRIQRMRNREGLLDFVDPERRAYCIVERNTLESLQQGHRTRHRGGELVIADNSHFRYVLIRNFRPDHPTD